MSSSDSFPAIEESFRFLPHSPSFTYNLLASTSQTPDVDLPPISPTDATTIIRYPEPIATSKPIPQTTFLTLPHFPYHLTHTVTVRLPHSTTPNSAMSLATTATPSPTATTSSTPSSSTIQGLPQGAKIGIALGITVTVLLSLLACTIGALSLRRRVLKQRLKKRARRASELAMLEVEMHTGRADGGRKEKDKDIKTGGGLWDELKVPLPVYHSKEDEKRERGDAERKNKSLWERVGASRSAGVDSERAKRKGAEARGERDRDAHAESLPVYVPHDRGSVVSSVGSLGVPGATRAPVSVRSFLAGRS